MNLWGLEGGITYGVVEMVDVVWVTDCMAVVHGFSCLDLVLDALFAGGVLTDFVERFLRSDKQGLGIGIGVDCLRGRRGRKLPVRLWACVRGGVELGVLG